MASHYDGPSIDHSLISPNGRISKRAKASAIALHQERVSKWWAEKYPEPSEAAKADAARVARIETIRRSAANLRDLAGRGMTPRKFAKAAAAMDAEADALSL